MGNLRNLRTKDNDDVPLKMDKLHRSGRIWWILYALTLLVCIAAYAIINPILKNIEKSEQEFMRRYITLLATNPNIAAPGECGTSLDCRGPIEINKVELLGVGSTARSGNLLVTLMNANIGANSKEDSDTSVGEFELLLEFSIENMSTDEFHYGGPVYESQLQDLSTEYAIKEADPQTLLEVVAFPPREIVKGRLFYLVPTNQRELYWVFQNRLSGSLLVFAIPHK